MANRFYTLLLVPEKSASVRRFVIPSWMVNSGLVILFAAALLSVLMTFDYLYVLDRLKENKQLQLENRKLRQQVQIFRNQMTSVEQTIDRIDNFATRLRVITNIQDQFAQGSSPSSNAPSLDEDEKKKPMNSN